MTCCKKRDGCQGRRREIEQRVLLVDDTVCKSPSKKTNNLRFLILEIEIN